MDERLQTSRVAGLSGTIRPPSDKSLTHRALLFAASAGGPSGGLSVIDSPLESEDCLATAEALGETGVEVEFFAPEPGQPGRAVVTAPGRPSSPGLPLDCGNSGTAMRLLMGWLAGWDGMEATLVGDASLSRRPMARVAEPLRAMGALVEGDRPPVQVFGRQLTGIRHASPVASAQVKSAVLIAGLRAHGTTFVSEPAQSRDHTERMLEGLLGVEVLRDGPNCVGVAGGQDWPPFHFRVPADISSAAFWMVGAALLPGSDVRLAQVGLNPTRTGVLEILEDSGAEVAIDGLHEEGGEPVGDVSVRGGRRLSAFTVEGGIVPRLIDEVPVLAVLASQCDGVSEFRGVGELRVKESDRIAATVALLNAMGGSATETEDGFRVLGPTPLRGAELRADGDHRIAMAAAVAGLVASGTTTVLGAGTIRTSYPGFEDDLRALAVV
jgi:3-phosphoshikimate 1-carboxyvinyltransferase